MLSVTDMIFFLEEEKRFFFSGKETKNYVFFVMKIVSVLCFVHKIDIEKHKICDWQTNTSLILIACRDERQLRH